MQLPLQITWRDIDRSEAVEAAIRRHANKLEEFGPGIMNCRVVVGKLQGRHQQGNLYSIHLNIHAPEQEISVTREPGDIHRHEDMYAVIRDAFDAAYKQLKRYSDKRRGHIKTHEVRQSASVERTYPDQDYGFLISKDGRQIYFHRNALVNTELEKLDKGTAVHYVEEMGNEGPQARQVSLIDHLDRI